jgi:hypothetical protein
MNERMPPEGSSLGLAEALRVDQVCNRFEAAWRGGPPPRVEDFLVRCQEPERSELLRELIALDVYHRRRRGEECRAEDYRGRFPALDPDELAEAFAESVRPPEGATLFMSAGARRRHLYPPGGMAGCAGFAAQG